MSKKCNLSRKIEDRKDVMEVTDVYNCVESNTTQNVQRVHKRKIQKMIMLQKTKT